MLTYKFTSTQQCGVQVALKPGEAVVAEPGAFIWGHKDIEAQTTTGGLTQMAKRAIAGENLFQVRWQNIGRAQASVAFAAPYLSKIEVIQLDGSSDFNLQRGAFLAAEPSLDLGVKFDIGLSGFFAGEGLIFQKFRGIGDLFFHAGGDIVALHLDPGEVLQIDTGCVVGFADTVRYSIRSTGGIFTSLFGGEGLVLAELTGPGLVILQTHPENEIGRAISNQYRNQ